MTTGNLIVGAGGHGKVIADMMLLQGMHVLGFLDDDPSVIGTRVLNLPVLGKSDQWADFHPESLVVGIGDNVIRRKVVQNMEAINIPTWATITHPNAIVSSSVQLGDGVVIMAGVIINPDAVVGNHSIVNTGATIDHDCIIGDFVHVAPGANIAGGVHIDHGTFLGIGCAVIPNCTIGSNTVIGAGSVVIGNIPSNVIAKGVPARWN